MAADTAPLQGRTILVTRAAHQAQSTLDAVARRGGVPLLLPCLEVVHQPHVSVLALQALREHRTADLLITSRNGINSLLAASSAVDLQQWIGRQRRVIAVGDHTAHALEQIGLTDVVVPQCFSQQGVAAWWDQHGWPQQLLFIRAEKGRDDLIPLLHSHHCALQLFACYGSRVPSRSPPKEIMTQLQKGGVDAVLLGSRATVAGLIARVGIDFARQPIAVAISQRVADASIQLGLRVQVVATQASFEAMLDQLSQYLEEMHDST